MHVQWLMHDDSFVKCFDLACSQSTENNSNMLAWQELIVLVYQFLKIHLNLGPSNAQISSGSVPSWHLLLRMPATNQH